MRMYFTHYGLVRALHRSRTRNCSGDSRTTWISKTFLKCCSIYSAWVIVWSSLQCRRGRSGIGGIKSEWHPSGFPLNLISQRAYDALMEYRSTQPRKTQIGLSIRPSARWSPPLVGWYKTNFDAMIFKEEDRAGVGVVIRDTNGLVMASLS